MYKIERSTPATTVSAPNSPSPLIPQVKVVSTQPPEGARPQSAPINADVAPGRVVVEGGSPTPTAKVEAPISQPDANGGAIESTPASPEADPRMAELARKEMLLREEGRKIAEQKAELEAMRKPPEPVKQGMTADEWKAKFLQDPASVGMSYQEMADRYLNQPSEESQKFSALEAKIAELESKLGQGNKVLEEAQAKAYTNAMNQIKAQTAQLVETSPQDFELISSQSAHQDVVTLIEDTYRAEGRLMSVRQAAEQVEQQLLDRALSFAAVKKVKEKMIPKEEPALTSPALEKAGVAQATTLSQTMTSGAKLTSSQIRERAIARARGQQ